MFLLSGFCGLSYQVVWLRKAFAAFGIITPVLSVVISIFMLGLSLGSLAGGKCAAAWRKRIHLSPIVLYGVSELIIGLGAFAVPKLFMLGENFLLSFGEINSFTYMALSAAVITGAILPWCFFMGMTYPLMMGFISETDHTITKSFSFLYLANVIGAMLGALLTAVVLVEQLGFARTLMLAAFINFFIALISFYLGYRYSKNVASSVTVDDDAGTGEIPSSSIRIIFATLFITGFCSMSMEVVWTRAFTPVMKTTIYAFAMLLTIYLFATGVGSYLYRKHAAAGKAISLETVCALTITTSILPLILNDPRLDLQLIGIFFGIFPFCMLLGYLTPQLIDMYSGGNPSRAGQAYAINIIGCILGPLFAGYFLLPVTGVKWGLLFLSIPFILLFLISLYVLHYKKIPFLLGATGIVLMIIGSLFNTSYEERAYHKHKNGILLRDHTATVIALGSGMAKMLMVNGIGMTSLTPITKFMAHMSMAFAPKPPEKALVICFGMGTTFRSFLSWNIRVTAVELIPSVKIAFPYFFADAQQLMKNPLGQIIVDDGRRYLKRTGEQYDIIAIDPPPPVEAAGSSLLYSKEFYALLKTRLSKHGILQQWFPRSEGEASLYAVTRSIRDSFPYVKVFRSCMGGGFHFFASMEPFDVPDVSTFIAKMPERARIDLMEWVDQLEWVEDKNTPIAYVVGTVLNYQIPIERISSADPSIYISDDRPYNEYFFLRRFLPVVRFQRILDRSCMKLRDGFASLMH